VRVAVALLALVLAACGPINVPAGKRFFVVFHNRGTFTQDVTVREARGGAYLQTSVRRTVPAGAELAFALDAAAPELVDVEAGWGRLTWSGPEIAGTWVLHVSFPDGSSWKGYP
jgi:hypothetical protein